MFGLSLYTSQVTCPCFHLLYASFLCFNLVSSNVFIHADLLAFLNIFLLVEMDCCETWRWSFNIHQLSWVPLLFIQWDTSKQIHEEQVCCSVVQNCDLPFCPPSIPSQYWTLLSLSLQPRPPSAFTVAESSFFCECEQSISSYCFFSPLEQEGVTDALQDPPALCMPCCIPQVCWSVPQVMQDYECEATLSFEQKTGLGISHVQTGLSYDPVMLVHFLDYHMIICDSLLWGESFSCERWLPLRAICH